MANKHKLACRCFKVLITKVRSQRGSLVHWCVQLTETRQNQANSSTSDFERL